MKEHWQKAVNGDKQAEDAIFRHLNERFRLLAGLVMCKEDAEDISNEACAAVLRGYKSLGEPYEYGAWAQKILKNKIASYFQRKSVEGRMFDNSHTYLYETVSSDRTDTADMIRTLISCLRKLVHANNRYARAVNLVQLGYNTEEICSKMNVTRNNLYVILNRGRAMLKNCLSQDGSEK